VYVTFGACDWIEMIISNFKIDQELVHIFSHFGVVPAMFFGGSNIYFEVKLYN